MRHSLSMSCCCLHFLLHFLLLLLPLAHSARAPRPCRHTLPSTWFGIDDLNRTLPLSALTPPLTPNRTLGIFYFLWSQPGQPGPYDNSLLLAAAGGDRRKVKYGPPFSFHHWGEPLFGYYLSQDDWVIRKHAQMLADASVDFVCFDVTNALTYDTTWSKILQIYTEMRAEGNRTPQITWILWNAVPQLVTHLYELIYSQGKYEELWFRWEGKPLLLANQTGVNSTIVPFFTWRESWAWTEGQEWFGDGEDKWPWADWYPQRAGHHGLIKKEQMPVMVGGWATSNVGRSCVAGPTTEPPHDKANPSIGHYFRQQFSWALNRTCNDHSFDCSQTEIESEVPSVIFVTGWNEWIAQRFIQGTGRCVPFLGEGCEAGDSYFVDEYTQEFSRDIEPMTGGHSDNYYMQLMAYSRYYKGSSPVSPASPLREISIDCAFHDWIGVQPRYEDDRGDVWVRHYAGYGNSSSVYSDDSTLDDLCDTMIALGKSTLYFYLSTCTQTWNRTGNGTFLYLGSGKETGWGGFDFRVSVESKALYKSVGNWREAKWERVSGVDICISEKSGEMELGISREGLGKLNVAERNGMKFVAKWWNGKGDVEKVVDFLKLGDAAPNARFSYVYDNSQGGISAMQ